MKTDVLAFGEVMMRLQVPGFKKLEQSRTLDYLFSGTGVNVLSALSRYGHKAQLISKLPQNSLGDAALSYLRSLGISTSHILRGGDYLGMYFLENGFGTRPSQITYTNRKESAFCQSNPHEYDAEKLFQHAKMIHFCGISLAVTQNVRETVIYLATEAKKRGVIVTFDCNYRPKLWQGYEQAKPWYEQMLSLADICFMTEKDAIHLLGMQVPEQSRKEQIEYALPKVMEKFQISTIAGTIREVITVEQQKLTGFLIQNGDITYSKTHSFQILDRVGGGDGFASGILHGILNNLNSKETIDFAIASGVMAHTTYGDSPVCNLEDIKRYMQKNTTELDR